jgi:hypothetical protein
MAKERKLRKGSKTRAKGCTHASVSANIIPEESIAAILLAASETAEMSNMERVVLDAGATVDTGPTNAEATVAIIRQTTTILETVFIFSLIERLKRCCVFTSTMSLARIRRSGSHLMNRLPTHKKNPIHPLDLDWKVVS